MYIRQSIEFSSEKELTWRYLKLAEIYYKLQVFCYAAYYANFRFPKLTSYSEKRNYYRILTNLATIQSEYKTANDYMLLYMAYNDSANMQKSQSAFGVVKEIYDMKEEVSRVRKNRWKYSAVITLSIAVCAYAGIWYWRKAKKQVAAKKEWAEKELKIKTEQTAKEHRAKMRYNLLSKIREQQKTQSLLRKKMSFSERDEQDIKILKNELHYDKSDVFFKKMNPLFNNLPQRIEQDCPKITSEEIMYCYLFLIGLSLHEIALIFNIKEESARKIKQRLAKKMNFETTAQFKSYLNQFL